MEIDPILQDRRETILQVAARHGARDVRVFGSRARGTARPDSDVDILVKLEAGRSLLDLIAIKQDLEDLLGCKVDVVTEAAISPYIREQVLNEAVAL
jgi:predicted nucleotidyltransferase